MMRIKICTLVLAVCCYLGAWSQANIVQPAYDANNFNRFYGDSLPMMYLETIDSTFIHTSMFAGKTVYVDFWFTACPPCISEIPFSQALQTYFKSNTNIVFLNICIDNIERKQAWKNMVHEKQMPGVHVFYARNRPQKINLLRRLGVDDFPTYLLVHDLKISGYQAPRPSEKGFVHWAINQATKGISLASAYKSLVQKDAASTHYLQQHWPAIQANQPQ